MPLVETWRKGTKIWRCHETKLRANEFNPGLGAGRFHPLVDSRTAAPIPTIYAADEVAGALSESVFRNVPVRGSNKRTRRSALNSVCLSALVLRKHIVLADLTGLGLHRIGVRRSQLIESASSSYAATAQWAEAIHRDTTLDGLMWVSRQNDRALAILLFGDRVATSDLDILVEALPLDSGTGWNLVLDAAEAADITVSV